MRWRLLQLGIEPEEWSQQIVVESCGLVALDLWQHLGWQQIEMGLLRMQRRGDEVSGSKPLAALGLDSDRAIPLNRDLSRLDSQ